MTETVSCDAKDLKSEIHKTLLALAGRGHVVFKALENSIEGFDAANTFQAGVGKSPELLKKCHMILNPDYMDQNLIAHTVGDVFLEWIHRENRRHAPIQDIR